MMQLMMIITIYMNTLPKDLIAQREVIGKNIQIIEREQVVFHLLLRMMIININEEKRFSVNFIQRNNFV